MKAAGLILLGLACTMCLIRAQGQDGQLPAHDAKNLKRPQTYVPLWPLAHIDKWKPFKQPPGYPALASGLRSAIEKGDWSKATDLARKLLPMIPDKTPDDYPWSHDTKAQCEAGIADLLALQGNWDEAKAIYEKVLKETPKSRQGGARQSASYGLANMYAVSFKFAEAQKLIETAGSEYWSGCGNCSEGEAVGAHISKIVYSAADRPLPDATKGLLRVINGNFEPYKAELMGPDNGKVYQQKAAAIEASFYLGVVYERAGDKINARRAYAFCVAKANGERGGFEPTCAWEKLKILK